jgi:3-dehydroquinate synthase
MKSIQSNNYTIEIGNIQDSSFAQLLSERYANAKKVIIADENTHANCFEYMVTSFEALHDAELIVLPAGEDSKQMSIAYSVWEALTEYGISRHDLIINLGGGMITDIGGFIASCYKRGCDFVNIPTSLLAMVDASIGGKTGINMGPYKNQIGVFSDPEAVFIDLSFLKTLPEVELRSGYAEMIKHGLINDGKLYNDVVQSMANEKEISEKMMMESIQVKNEVVSQDPRESGLRKTLNFGHTIGHVIEGYYLPTLGLSHGHAVAIGMVMETYLSVLKVGLNREAFDSISTDLLKAYSIPEFSNDDIESMLMLLSNDKKNKEGRILCCLISEIGTCVYDQEVTLEEFRQVFQYFQK